MSAVFPAFLPDYIDRYWTARGWRPRRIYVTTRERYELAVSEASRQFLIRDDYGIRSIMMFDGCEIKHCFHPEVAHAIRAWDLS